ncbi:MAG: glycosyltransferase family 2 protein [bacterium]|nr:glycosyltransferase family 2 protein [bacterium]
MRILPSLTIAIPAYNEEENIEWVVKDALKNLPKYFKDYEIVVVDDGSKDKTGEIADRLAKENSRVRVIHQPNGGYSKAMSTGILNARKDFVAYMPADGQYLVADMAQMYPLMDTSDLVLGYRGIRKDYNLYRKILSYGYLIFLWLLFGISVKDLNGPTIWRTTEAKKLKEIYSTHSKGVFILAEIVARFKRRGLHIREAQSIYRPRRGGTVKNTKFRVVKDTFIDAAKLWFRMQTGKV